jgi:SET domain-containing protein
MTTPELLLPFVMRPSSVHGLGAFATGPIRAGTEVVEYRGEKITKAESLRRCEANNRFIFQLDDAWDLDGDVPWNLARFLNHSCAPNCEAELVGDEIWIVARRDIEVGEELTFNYGYDLADYRDYPCHCGTPECVGYILAEEFFPLVRRRQQNTATAL